VAAKSIHVTVVDGHGEEERLWTLRY
jgi:hypothetical protein